MLIVTPTSSILLLPPGCVLRSQNVTKCRALLISDQFNIPWSYNLCPVWLVRENLYNIYKPFVAPFVQTLAEDVLAPLFAEEEASTHYTFGLDLA
jgi:hypothetical protein